MNQELQQEIETTMESLRPRALANTKEDVDGEFSLEEEAQQLFQQLNDEARPRPVRVRGVVGLGAKAVAFRASTVAAGVVSAIVSGLGAGTMFVGLGSFISGILLALSGLKKLNK